MKKAYVVTANTISITKKGLAPMAFMEYIGARQKDRIIYYTIKNNVDDSLQFDPELQRFRITFTNESTIDVEDICFHINNYIK